MRGFVSGLLMLSLAGCSTAAVKPAPVVLKADADTWGEGDAVCLRDQCVRVKLARTMEERQQGLKFIEHLPEDAGMLFEFEAPGNHPFWMKETRISLDMIWLDQDRRVLFIADHVPPCADGTICPSYGLANAPAMYVLEVNAGYAQTWGVAIGTQLTFHLIDKRP